MDDITNIKINLINYLTDILTDYMFLLCDDKITVEKLHANGDLSFVLNITITEGVFSCQADKQYYIQLYDEDNMLIEKTIKFLMNNNQPSFIYFL